MTYFFIAIGLIAIGILSTYLPKPKSEDDRKIEGLKEELTSLKATTKEKESQYEHDKNDFNRKFSDSDGNK